MLLIISLDALLIAPRRDVIHSIDTLNHNDAPVCTDVTIVSTCSLTPMVDSIIVRMPVLGCTTIDSIVPTHARSHRRTRSRRKGLDWIDCIDAFARTGARLFSIASLRLLVSRRCRWYRCSRSHRYACSYRNDLDGTNASDRIGSARSY